MASSSAGWPEVQYLAGAEYSIADIACYPWTLAATTFLKDTLSDSLKTKPQIARWLNAVGDRPAVQRGMQVPQINLKVWLCLHKAQTDQN